MHYLRNGGGFLELLDRGALREFHPSCSSSFNVIIYKVSFSGYEYASGDSHRPNISVDPIINDYY